MSYFEVSVPLIITQQPLDSLRGAEMHEPRADCKGLIEITTDVLSCEDLQRRYGIRR